MTDMTESQGLSFVLRKGRSGFSKKPLDLFTTVVSGYMSIILTTIAFVLVVAYWPSISYQAAVAASANQLEAATSSSSPQEFPPEVVALIANIRLARKRAEAASSRLKMRGRSLSEEEEEEEIASWHRSNPCMSRDELWPLYNQRQHSQVLEPHPYLGAVLDEYSKLHRTCMKNVGGDVVGFFKSRNSSTGCKFVMGDNEVATGLGNKVLSAVAAVMYSILTQRVLLIPVTTSIPGVMCEPFVGSSWKVVTDGILTPAKFHTKFWSSVQDVYKEVDAHLVPSVSSTNLHSFERPDYNTSASNVSESETGSQTNLSSFAKDAENSSLLYAARVNEDWDCQPEKRFFCDAVQEFYRTEVTWMYFSECLYYLPKLFAVPTFRPTLEALFPDRMVLTHLLRVVMLPSDPVWLRVRQVNNVHLKHIDHRVGIQTRYFHGKEEWESLHEATARAVAMCLLDNHLLPNTSLSNTLNEEIAEEDRAEACKAFPPDSQESFLSHQMASRGDDESEDIVFQDREGGKNSESARKKPLSETTYSVFITSLYNSLKDHLTKIYVRNPVATGETVALIQLTHEDKQQFGVEVDRQALTEVLGLSLSDNLITTAQSTFGAIAAGYGALVPWFIDIRQETATGCVKGHTVDACFQIPSDKHFRCPGEVALDGKLIADEVPYIRDCHEIETPFVPVHGATLGFQLITNFSRISTKA